MAAAARTSRTAKTRTTAKPKPRRDWKPAWLEAFRETGLVTRACERAKVGRRTVYDARKDEEFAAAWDAIEAEITEVMEREAFRRAVEGVTEPVVSAGKHVADVQKYSDTLLIFMLKARKPEVYRENVKVEHSGKIDSKTTVEIPGDAVDKSRKAAELLQGLGQVDAAG